MSTLRYTLATLYYGDRAPRYDAMLAAWLQEAEAVRSASIAGVHVLSDRVFSGLDSIVLRPHGDCPRREGDPFDLKGALMCSALIALPGPLLILDLDAVLQRDPTPALAPFAESLIALPVDSGAARNPLVRNNVPKKCAGVAWFGRATPEEREILVRKYCDAWQSLASLHRPQPGAKHPKQSPHLLEQHAWSLANFRCGRHTLPDSMNWPAHHRGPMPGTEGAYVHHNYGQRKWRAAA